MSGGGSRNQTTTTQVNYPDWLEGPMRENINYANQLASQMGQQGYQYYNPQDRFADFNDLQLNALQNARDSTGTWNPLFQRGVDANASGYGLASQAAGSGLRDYSAQSAYAGPSAMVRGGNFLDADVGAYMNPYTDRVTNNALAKLEGQRQVQNVANADAANKARAFGGSRHGVVEAQTNEAFAKQGAETSLNAASGNFLNAQNLIQQDLNRNLQAQGMNQQAGNQMNQFNAGLAQQANMHNSAQGLQADLAMRGLGMDAARFFQQGAGTDAHLASQYQQRNSNDINNMMTAGNMLQDQDQLYRDFAYQQWMGAQQFPIDLLNLRMGAVSGTPYQPGSSTTSPIYRNRGQGFLGGASAGYGMGGPWGAAIGGILGAFG